MLSLYLSELNLYSLSNSILSSSLSGKLSWNKPANKKPDKSTLLFENYLCQCS